MWKRTDGHKSACFPNPPPEATTTVSLMDRTFISIPGTCESVGSIQRALWQSSECHDLAFSFIVMCSSALAIICDMEIISIMLNTEPNIHYQTSFPNTILITKQDQPSGLALLSHCHQPKPLRKVLLIQDIFCSHRLHSNGEANLLDMYYMEDTVSRTHEIWI